MIYLYTLKLRDIREENDLKQINISKYLKTTRQAYAMWENNVEIIPLLRLKDLCNYFQVSMDYVFNVENVNHFQHLNEIDKIKMGDKIKAIRKEHRVTQRELAQILNTTQSTICAYESGKTLILTAFLYKFCKFFKKSMDEMCSK